jgi:radical SAM protein with 4Fe4S-binding SPASM domain
MPDCKDIGVYPLGQTSHSEEMWRRLQEKSPYPLSVMMSLTGRCNARCGHCELVLEQTDCDELSLPEISAMLDQLQNVGVLSLTFTGGEPCLRDDLADIVAHAVAKRFYVTLKTNGSLLHEVLARSLIDAGLGGIHISIYHDYPSLHDEFVGIEGAWSRAMNAAFVMRKLGVRVQLSLIAMNWNADAIFRLVEYCRKQQFAFMIDTQISSRRGNDRSSLSYQASTEQIEALLCDPGLLDKSSQMGSLLRKPVDSVCGAAVHSCYIHHNGEVWPCGRLPFSMGNLTSTNFKDIWLTSAVREQVLNTRWQSLPKCKSCEVSGLCSRCLAGAHPEQGVYVSPDPRECAAALAVARLIGHDRNG